MYVLSLIVRSQFFEIAIYEGNRRDAIWGKEYRGEEGKGGK
jgi:hypothetical protein